LRHNGRVALRSITFFVGNLPFRSGEEEVRHLLESQGLTPERIEVISDRVTGKPKGFAFVTLKAERAQDVIEAVSGQTLRGREIRLEVSTSKRTRERRDEEEERGGQISEPDRGA
jgi:RNA recognition motif-containing protein